MTLYCLWNWCYKFIYFIFQHQAQMVLKIWKSIHFLEQLTGRNYMIVKQNHHSYLQFLDQIILLILIKNLLLVPLKVSVLCHTYILRTVLHFSIFYLCSKTPFKGNTNFYCEVTATPSPCWEDIISITNGNYTKQEWRDIA